MPNVKFVSEFRSLIIAFRPWFFSLLLVSAAVFSLPVSTGSPGGEASQTPAQIVIDRFRRDFLNPEIQLVVLAPTEAFVSQAGVSLLLAFLITLPLLIIRVYGYVSPALRRPEALALTRAVITSGLLFLAGTVFGYIMVVPITLKVLYAFAGPLNVQQLLSLSGFIGLITGSIFISGLIFQIPVSMFLLTKIGLVPASRWRRHWRAAVLAFLIFTAMITPDGSGVTMLLLAGPLICLYCFGTFFTKDLTLRNIKQ